MKKLLFIIKNQVVLLTCLLVVACNNNLETCPGFIVITSPTGNEAFSTQSDSIDISGFCMNHEPFSNISWLTSNGTGGTISASQKWTIADIPLEPGDTVITVEMVSVDGSEFQDVVTVSHNPFVSFAGSPRAEPDTFFTEEETQIEFTVALNNTDNLTVESVEVVQVNNESEGAASVVELKDDGSDDGVYSGIALFSETEEQKIKLRVVVTTIDQGQQRTSYSEVFILSVIEPFTDDEIDFALLFPAQVKHKYDENKALYDEKTARENTVAWLVAQSEVVDAGFQDPDSGIWYEMSSGFVQGLLLSPRSTTGTQHTSLKRFDIKQTEPEKVISADYSSADADERIGNNKALVLSSFHTEFGNYSTLPALKDIFAEAPCPGMKVTTFTDNNSDVSAFKTMGSYGAVVLDSHGDLVKGMEIIMTGEVATKENVRSYTADIKAADKRLIGHYHNNTLYYAITPAFVRYYCKNMPDSIVDAACCYSLNNGMLANAFLSSGAKVYSGYTHDVSLGFAKDVVELYWFELVCQTNAQQAYSSATSIVSICDSSACFLWGGDGDRRLPPKGPCTTEGYTRVTLSGTIGNAEYNSYDVIMYDPVEGQYRITERQATCSVQYVFSLGEDMEYSTTCSGLLNETYEEGEEPYKFSFSDDGTDVYFDPNPDAEDYHWITCITSFGEERQSNECWDASWPKIWLEEEEITDSGISGTRTVVSELGTHSSTLVFDYLFPEKQ